MHATWFTTYEWMDTIYTSNSVCLPSEGVRNVLLFLKRIRIGWLFVFNKQINCNLWIGSCVSIGKSKFTARTAYFVCKVKISFHFDTYTPHHWKNFRAGCIVWLTRTFKTLANKINCINALLALYEMRSGKTNKNLRKKTKVFGGIQQFAKECDWSQL